MSKKSTSNSDTFFPLTSWFSSYFFPSLPTKRRGQTWRKTHRKMTSQFRLRCIHVKTNLRPFHFIGKLFFTDEWRIYWKKWGQFSHHWHISLWIIFSVVKRNLSQCRTSGLIPRKDLSIFKSKVYQNKTKTKTKNAPRNVLFDHGRVHPGSDGS